MNTWISLVFASLVNAALYSRMESWFSQSWLSDVVLGMDYMVKHDVLLGPKSNTQVSCCTSPPLVAPATTARRHAERA